MRMYKPPHPGEILGEDILATLGLTITAAAEALDVSRKTLSAIINGRQGTSAEMALRIEKAFGGSAEHWLRMQDFYDLYEAKKNVDLRAVQTVTAA